MHFPEQFHTETRLLYHRRVDSILLACIGLMLLFILLDSLYASHHFRDFLRLRLAAIGLCCLLLVANSVDANGRRALFIGSSGYLCTGLVILFTVQRHGGSTSPYYVGLIVLMTIYTTLAPLTLAQTLLSGFFLVALYLASSALLRPFAPEAMIALFSNLFFMICFVLIAATQSWADTAARRQECLLRLSEHEAAEALAEQASHLEEEVKRRTREQQATEAHYRLLYEAIADAVILISDQGMLIQANSCYLHTFGPQEWQPGHCFFDTVRPDQRSVVEQALRQIQRSGEALLPLQVALRSADGQFLETEINGALLQRGPTVLGVQLVIRDISIRRALEDQLRTSLINLRQTENAAILALAKLSEYRDVTPGHHLERIREFSTILAAELARWSEWADILAPATIQQLGMAAILHDIGKVALADGILAKPAEQLSQDEKEALRDHTRIGGDVLKAMELEAGGSEFLAMATRIAYSHHERWDGSGYPLGLCGEAIPLEARIVALADTYEELTTNAMSGQGMSHAQAREWISLRAGSWYDPRVVEAFLCRQDDFQRIHRTLGEPGPPSRAEEPV